MIRKEHSVPIKLIKQEALLRRLAVNHQKRTEVESEFLKRKAGYKGELAIDYYLNLLPDKDYLIFHDLRLPNDTQSHFQIDTLLLTPRFILILEVKNMMGTLYFDRSFNQLIRTTGEVETGFPDPISQAKRQLSQLKCFLLELGIENIPLEYLIVIANPSSIIKTDSYQIKNFVIHNHSLLEKIKAIENRYIREIVDNKQLKKVTKTLLKSHTPETYDVLQHFGLSQNEIKTGVQCPSCHNIPMKRVVGTWHCPSCGVRDKKSHTQALQDYFLLLDSSITNQQFREFMHISSENVAKKLLTSMNLVYSGYKKSRVYYHSM